MKQTPARKITELTGAFCNLDGMDVALAAQLWQVLEWLDEGKRVLKGVHIMPFSAAASTLRHSMPCASMAVIARKGLLGVSVMAWNEAIYSDATMAATYLGRMGRVGRLPGADFRGIVTHEFAHLLENSPRRVSPLGSRWSKRWDALSSELWAVICEKYSLGHRVRALGHRATENRWECAAECYRLGSWDLLEGEVGETALSILRAHRVLPVCSWLDWKKRNEA